MSSEHEVALGEGTPDYIMIDSQCYLAADFHAAVNGATLEAIGRLTPKGATRRQLLRLVQGLKTPAAHESVMRRAREIVRQYAATPLTEVLKQGVRPIAAFPPKA